MTVARSVADSVSDVTATAMGRERRDDPVLPVTGGPAGNAQLTAWLGILLLLLCLAELATLLDIGRLIGWHVAIGVLLVPPALAKTVTTGWRVVRYYAGARPYRVAGPPPLLLRALGPLVVATTLAVLGSGLALLAIGQRASYASLLTVAGQDISPLTLHKASFVVWGVATGLHVLGRLVPAARLALSRGPDSARVPGAGSRWLAMLAVVAVAAVAAIVVLRASDSWTGDAGHRYRFDDRTPAGAGTAPGR